ncbi:ribosomal RNA processing protein 1 homolog isoform X1 [Copidosoma floridanum]|uniref:ribosomal RNA processing protein 1 homolog isoform X1 n=1 Tax=Copidosoma floridanum TaxID=29053 RepID=UPI0006C980B4|nr:ribosomal RNA processing protein 1 homolog isoform X1 [Copidosoma floridanum]
MKVLQKNKKGAKAAPMLKLKVKKKRTRVRAKKQMNSMARLPETAAVKSNAPKKTKDDKSLLVAQEVKFARLLAHNDKKVRDKVLKNLKRWLTVRSRSSFAFTEEDFLRLWKGLFYCMWMSDKPLVQEDLAESLSNLVHCFESIDTALLYTKCTLKSLATEWLGLDNYRVDKFEMLVRRILRQTFVVCKKLSWKKKCVVGVGKVLEEILMDAKNCLGLKLHITNVYMEELAKVGEEKIPESMVTEFVRPYVIYLASIDDMRQISHIVKSIFRYLIFQSEVGSEYLEKYDAWRRSNFPCDSIDQMQKVEISDDEDEAEALNDDEDEVRDSKCVEKPLDPRAGMVDVDLPPILFDASQIAQILKENKFHQASTAKNRKWITKLINDFTKLSQGEMPIGMKKVPDRDEYSVNTFVATKELLNFNKELYSDSGKSHKRKKNNGSLELEELTPPDTYDESNNTKNVNVSNFPKKKKLKHSKNLDNTGLTNKRQSENSNVICLKEGKKVSKNASDINEEGIKNFQTASEGFIKIDKKLNNWNVETLAPESALTSMPNTSEKKKKLKKKKIPTGNRKKLDPFPSNMPWLTPVLTRLEHESKTPSPKKSALQTPKTDSAKKRVKIALQKNMAQNTSEYFRKILQNPEIPFDANRKPKASVLKPSPLPSPVNPFYKKKLL